MATVELADFDEQLDEIICEHKVKKAKERRLQRKELRDKTQEKIEKINSLKNEKLIKKSNQIFVEQILRLYHSEDYFCDLIIECDKFFKYLHSCIFLARVPVLFELLKKQFTVGNDQTTSSISTLNCSTAHSNPLYDNSDCLNTSLDHQQVINPHFLHIRLPCELIKVFNLNDFLQSIYSSDSVQSEELELILILNKIKLLQDQRLLTLENLLNLDCRQMKEWSNDKVNEVEECKRMKVKNEPLYINLEDKINTADKENVMNRESNYEPPKNDSLKKGKTFLLSKVNIENEQFEINLLNDEENCEIVNKLANIDNEIKEMENQIDLAVANDQLCIDPENEEQQLITALSNEKIEINELINDELIYGNIKPSAQKEQTDTVSDVSEICDEYSENNREALNGEALKYSDSLEIRNIGDIELNFDKKEDEDTVNERSSLFYELMNIENKVQQVTNDKGADEKRTMLIASNETYSSYENDLEDKTLSGSMVRSGTFNLMQTPVQTDIKSKSDLIDCKLTESEDESSLSRKIEQDSLMSNPNIETKSTTKLTSKQLEQQEKFTKKSLQYFFDETQIKEQLGIEEMERSLTNNKQTSGLFFVDLEDPQLNVSMSKSSTFDRKKNKHNQRAMSASNESSLNCSVNSSFIDDKKASSQQPTNDNTSAALLPMSMILKKENDVGMFRLGNQHFKTIASTNMQTHKTSRQSSSASTLRNNLLKKTKSEVTNATLQNHENESDEIIQKSLLSYTRLGQDLLKLFLNQKFCDFTLLVADKSQRLKAHKCILTARSEFFAEKFFSNLDCNQINLTDFSYDSVHFVLCHIYSGTIDIPNFSTENRIKCTANDVLNNYHHLIEYEELNLAELLSLCDLFQLSILKDVILFEIKKNYCHQFHKPVNDCQCIAGVINGLHLAQKCELPSLFNCSITWLCRHFKKIWPTKQFATLFTQPSVVSDLPQSNCKSRFNQPVHKNNGIINSIYNAMLDGLTNDNVVDRVLNLQQVTSSMTRLKWTEMTIQLIDELIEDCCKYLAINFDQIVSSQTFINLGLEKTWQLDVLETYLIRSVDSMKCETAIRVFIQLENIVIMCEAVNEKNNLGDGRSGHIYANTTKNQFSDEFIRVVQRLCKSIERYLIHNANEAVYCESWNDLSPNVQQYIKNSAVLVFEFEKPLAKRPVLSSSLAKSSSRQASADKTTSSAKRKNSDKMKSKKSSEDDQSRQSTLTRQSARKNSRLAKDSQSNEKTIDWQEDEQHIYDEVPVDLVNQLKERKECAVEYAKPVKKQPKQISQLQVAKVRPQLHAQPFSISSPVDVLSDLTTSLASGNYEDLDVENNYENIIYDSSLQKVGSESSLASSCLHEAETLEENLQELTRKVQNQRLNAFRQCRQSSKKTSNMASISNNISNNSNIGSPLLRTSLRSFNRQQSANSISLNSVNSASSNKMKVSTRSSCKKPPFK